MSGSLPSPASTPSIMDALNLMGPALTDPWVVLDDRDAIVEFNAAFRALFPRNVARGLRSMGCRDALKIPACAQGGCLRETSFEQGPLRLDELDVDVGGESRRMIISVLPVTLTEGQRGALLVLRDVTDEARVQQQYQRLAEEAERQRQLLESSLSAKTRELLIAYDELNRLEAEVARRRREDD